MTIMTKNKVTKYLFASLFLVLVGTQFQTVKAQEITAGADLVSTYVWRGVAYSDSPALQPWVEFAADGFAIGAWGSQNYDGGQEMDLYAGYSFDLEGTGLYLGLTDYYYPGSEWLDGDNHAFEVNAGLDFEEVSLSGNIILNEGAGSAGSDLYFEFSYNPGMASLFIGGGDGWHSSDGDFKIVNVGVGASKDIEVTDTFTIPLSGAAILNPDTEQFYILVGISF